MGSTVRICHGDKISKLMVDILAPYACKNTGFNASRRQ